MKNQLFEWFQWNNAANQSLISTFRNERTVPAKCREILSHIINEHETWLNRICAVSYTAIKGSSEDETIIGLRNANVHEITKNFLASESYGNNFDWSFWYQNDRGERINRSLSEVYFQILTYSEFHRGQVAKLLRENGIEPPSTDYLSLKN